MYLETGRKEECSGCTACAASCPRHCIRMVGDKEGFVYPEVDRTRCNSCGRCTRVCPFNAKSSPRPLSPSCYYGWAKKAEQRLESTSGGAFAALAEAMLQTGGAVVYGAAYTSNLRVAHLAVTDIGELWKLRKSKYVQSDMGEVFADVRRMLASGKSVLFSGTPCQVQGLLQSVDTKLKPSLYTVALVCHGVASPMVFSKYLREVSEKQGCLVKSVSFRDKRLWKGRPTHKCTTVSLADGRRLTSTENPYAMASGLGLITRPSCFACPFANPWREADMTIGDFWGLGNILPDCKEDLSRGISLLLAHTEKGESMIREMGPDFELHPAELSWAVNPEQPQLMHPMGKPAQRDSFMKAMVDGHSFLKRASFEIFKFKVRQSVRARMQNMGKKIFKPRSGP